MPAIFELVQRIDGLLPQTQCAKCGFDGCAPYAQAIAEGRADINRCPPGGSETITALAALTGREPRPLDPHYGTEGPRLLARIDEAACIGCALCIKACPVDAILGAPKRMHTVLPSLCTGCELCVPPCPVACIALDRIEKKWTRVDADAARDRYRKHAERVARGERIASRWAPAPPRTAAERSSRQAVIAEALARARARRAARTR